MKLLELALGAITSASIQNNVVHTESACTRCFGASDCNICSLVCPQNLLFLEDGVLISESSAKDCSGCGICAAFCPTQACSVEEKVALSHLQEFDKAVREYCTTENNMTLTLTCENYSDSNSLSVPCLRSISEMHVLHAWARGASTVKLCHGKCESCEKASSRIDHEEGAVSGYFDWTITLSKVGNTLPSQKFISVVFYDENNRSKDVDPSSVDNVIAYDRRQFFKSLSDKTREGTKTLLDANFGDPKEHTSSEIQHIPSLKRSISLAALEFLVQKSQCKLGAVPDTRPGSLSSHDIDCDSTSCILCLDCAKFCPTGALSVKPRSDSIELTYDPSLCVGCLQCDNLCRTNSLTLAPALLDYAMYGDAKTIWTGIQTKCESCKTVYVTAIDETTDPHGLSEEHKTNEGSGICPNCLHSKNRFQGFY